jgi:hypothetical protein
MGEVTIKRVDDVLELAFEEENGAQQTVQFPRELGLKVAASIIAALRHALPNIEGDPLSSAPLLWFKILTLRSVLTAKVGS